MRVITKITNHNMLFLNIMVSPPLNLIGYWTFISSGDNHSKSLIEWVYRGLIRYIWLGEAIATPHSYKPTPFFLVFKIL